MSRIPNSITKFWELVDKSSGAGCWPFMGHIAKDGYGHYMISGVNHSAHRLAYTDAIGEVGDGIIMHKCNSRKCCNPAHLLKGTHTLNNRHTIGSKRYPKPASGRVGVYWYKPRNCWRAMGTEQGKRIYLYQGPSYADAVAAREAWELHYGITFKEQINATTNI